MKISNEKPVGLQNEKSDYTPSVFKKSSNNNIPVIRDNSKNKNIDVVQTNKKSEKELNQLAKDINKLSEDKNISLVFSSDENTGKNIIKFVDLQTKEVVKQVPSEEILRITEQIDKFLKKNSKVFPTGFLLNERV